MDFPRLSIESSPARLQIEGGPAKLSIRTPPPDIQIQQQRPAIELSISGGGIEIDYRAARASLGYHSMAGFTGRIVQISQQARAEGIARIVQKGDFLADVAHHPNGVPAWSQQRMLAHAGRHEFGIAMLPGSPPEIEITPSNLSANSSYRPPAIQIGMREPKIDVRTRENEISLIPPSLRIFVTGSGSAGG